MHNRFLHIRWMPVLMTLTVLGIAAFQLYWLKKAYEREERTLEIRSNMAFRETVNQLQAAKLKLDKITLDSLPRRMRFESTVPDRTDEIRMAPDQKTAALMGALNERANDAVKENTLVFVERAGDSNQRGRNVIWKRNRLIQLLYDVDSLQDSVTVVELTASYAKRMEQQNIDVPFTIHRLQREKPEESFLKSREGERPRNEVTIGFRNPITYRLDLGNTAPYVIKRLSAPILLSVFLVGFTVISFSLLYRNLLRQRRLADIKNEFISNVTHELKTPIATVSVAIEALRSFNANMDAQKTKEYLDISANELQRLSLLVDKVLKLSMFENREIELKYEPLDMKALVNEVAASMRLQAEKHNAKVNVSAEGDTGLEGDRLHLVSVVFNLLDNALKYSNGLPQIDITVKGGANQVALSVRDNGIGIPAAYKDKIFDKFFRVPTGNLHNAKGYGLGLSYVARVVEKHGGTIDIETAEGAGSRFTVTLPKNRA